MMLGEPRHSTLLQTQVPPWPPLHSHHDQLYHSPPPSPVDSTPLHRYLLLLSSSPDDDDDGGGGGGDDLLEDYASDEFRMYEFKVRRCPRGRSHDWTECPFAHPGEKARRRDPRRHRYSGTACPDFRRGSCRKGDSCELAHGVFECWLHPSRYRTQPCKDGINCRRRVCFFAHTPHQLRHVEDHYSNYSPPSPSPLDSYDGSPLRRGKALAFSSSPPPSSPTAVSEVVLASALRRLQLSWGVPANSKAAAVGIEEEEEELLVERVESGRDLRARIAEKLSRENPLEGNTPDVDWVSDLLN